jgi:hypothetical protein
MLGVVGIGAAANAAVVTATTNGQINASVTWGGATLPTAGDTDTWNTAGYNMNFGDETFYGGHLTVTGGSLLDGGVGPDLVLQETTFDNGGIIMNNNTAGTFDFSGKALTFGSGGAAFSATAKARNINLLNAVWAGDGAISWTKTDVHPTQTPAAVFLILAANNDVSGYTGIISVNNTSGNLDKQARLTINAATTGSFGVNIGAGSQLDIRDAGATYTFSSLVLGGETIAPGTYSYDNFTASQKVYLLQGATPGEITVIPEPATLGLLGVFGGAMLFFRRRFMI